jgi:hypothetical protein
VTTLNQIGLVVRISKRFESTYASGKMIAQAEPSTRHPSGTNDVAHTTTQPRIATERRTENQNLVYGGDMHMRTLGAKMPKKLPHRFIILGTSLKKLERSTSFLVALHVILYENKCARIAWLRGMLSPPKKKKLIFISIQVLIVIDDDGSQERYPGYVCQK